MGQKIAYFIAAGMAAFMLFTAGGLMRITSQTQIAAAQNANASAPQQSTFTHEQDDDHHHHDNEPAEQDDNESRG